MTQDPDIKAAAFLEPGSNEWQSLAVTPESEGRNPAESLKNALLASLKMQRLVVLAGSGCSLSAGGPSMGDLWESSVGTPPTAEAKRIAIKTHHDVDGNKNIEVFLSKAEAFLQVNEYGPVRKFLNSSKKVILDKCSGFLKPEHLGAHETFLHRLSRRRVRDQRLKIFTTNYDLCFERATSALGGVALDGFSFTAPRRYDPRYFSYDIVRRSRVGDDLGHYLEGVYLLYKLHGSVNWERDEGGNVCENESPSPEKACLIYPASGKYQQSFVQPHLESMAQYLAAVREPNTCLLVIGFGFNDDHLAEPLLAAAQSNPHLRLIIVDSLAMDKHKNADNNRYWPKFFDLAHQGEDIWFIKESFKDFAQRIPDLRSLTPAESLMKAVKGAARES
jgi:hypothetical protein